MKAWLITRETYKGGNVPREEVVAVLSSRKSADKVREFVEQVSVLETFSPSEKVAYACRKFNPYPAEFDRIGGIGFQGRITCGHNPHYHARIVNNLRVVESQDGEEEFKWEEPPPFDVAAFKRKFNIPETSES